jgi:hypothetical protein
MKNLNHSAGQDFNPWPPRSIVGVLSIQLHQILYNECYILHHTHAILFLHGM